MTGLSLATCDRAFAPGGDAPQWVHLLSEGMETGRDGRDFDLQDPAALILAFQSSGIDLPIDYEHQSENADAKANGPVPAAGWIKELKLDDGKLWGRVEWTATAREMIQRREYRFLSPAFLYHPKTKAIVRLKGAGLVHTPNLHLTALAKQEDAMNRPAPKSETTAKPQSFSRLAAALKLPADATEDDMIAALMALLKGEETPDPAKYVPVATVQAVLAERNLNLATMSEGRAKAKVDEALRSGHISPAMRDWATALCFNDEASFDKFVSSSIPQFAHLMKPMQRPGLAPGQTRQDHGSEFADAICAQLGLKPGSLTE